MHRQRILQLYGAHYVFTTDPTDTPLKLHAFSRVLHLYHGYCEHYISTPETTCSLRILQSFYGLHGYYELHDLCTTDATDTTFTTIYRLFCDGYYEYDIRATDTTSTEVIPQLYNGEFGHYRLHYNYTMGTTGSTAQSTLILPRRRKLNTYHIYTTNDADTTVDLSAAERGASGIGEPRQGGGKNTSVNITNLARTGFHFLSGHGFPMLPTWMLHAFCTILQSSYDYCGYYNYTMDTTEATCIHRIFRLCYGYDGPYGHYTYTTAATETTHYTAVILWTLRIQRLLRIILHVDYGHNGNYMQATGITDTARILHLYYRYYGFYRLYYIYTTDTTGTKVTTGYTTSMHRKLRTLRTLHFYYG